MSEPFEVSAETLEDWPLPEPGSEKHRRGVVLVVAGSVSTPGAARLAGEAALRAGAGQLKLATAEATATALAVAVPEGRVYGLAVADSGDPAPDTAAVVAELAERCDAVLVGPGFVDPEGAAAFLHELVPSLDTTLVLDALASEYVARHAAQLAEHRSDCVLTMNPSELAHALDIQVEKVEADPTGAVTRLSGRTGKVVALGGAVKVVGAPDGACHVINRGGPGLAVSGSGDVQAGIVTGLLARGAAPDQAAVWGGWLHAAAGDRLAKRIGRSGFLARELGAEVPGLLDEPAT